MLDGISNFIKSLLDKQSITIGDGVIGACIFAVICLLIRGIVLLVKKFVCKSSKEQAAVIDNNTYYSREATSSVVVIKEQTPYSKIEKLIPELLNEMTNDIKKSPLCREFILLKKSWVYNGDGSKILVYWYDEHDDLDNKIKLLENNGFIRDVTFTNVKRYAMEEEFVDYLSNRNLSPK